MFVPEFDLFVAHAGPDTPAVRPLVDALRAASPALRVFFDKDDLPLGARWDQFLPTALDRARATVICWSAQASRGTWLASEVVRAIEKNKRDGHGVLPVFLDDAPPPYGVDVFHGVRLQELGVDGVVAKILAFLGGGAPPVDDGALRARLLGLPGAALNQVVELAGANATVTAGAPPSFRVDELIRWSNQTPDRRRALLAALDPPTPGPPPASEPTHRELVAILSRFTSGSFLKIVLDAGFDPANVLPETRTPFERADHLVTFAEETPAKRARLIAALRAHGSL